MWFKAGYDLGLHSYREENWREVLKKAGWVADLKAKELRLARGDKRRKQSMKDLGTLLKPTYFGQIPLDEIFWATVRNGLIPYQEDGTPWGGFLLGGVKEAQMVQFPLADLETGQPFNSAIVMSYYVMPSGKYEVIGYLA